MRTNTVKTRLAAGEVCRGIWMALPSVPAARLLARLPCDWIVVDAEHAPLDVATLTGIVGAIADARGPVPLVRVAAAAVEPIKRALDAGAGGVIAPMVNSRAEAEATVAAARYPPEGSRSFGSQWVALAFDTDTPTYLRAANAHTLVSVQIETEAALNALDSILSVPGVDLAFVGPIDLSLSLGLDPWADPAPKLLTDALAYIQRTAQLYGLPVGIFCANGRVAAQRITQGFQFVNVGMDTGAMLRGLTAELEAARGVTQ